MHKTQDQLKDELRDGTYLEKPGLISYMNDSKWNKIFYDITSGVVSSPMASIKYIRRNEIYGPSHVNWNEIIAAGRYRLIEWIKIQTIKSVHRGRIADVITKDHAPEYINWLRSRNVFFEISSEIITIYGYKPSAQQADAPEPLTRPGDP